MAACFEKSEIVYDFNQSKETIWTSGVIKVIKKKEKLICFHLNAYLLHDKYMTAKFVCPSTIIDVALQSRKLFILDDTGMVFMVYLPKSKTKKRKKKTHDGAGQDIFSNLLGASSDPGLAEPGCQVVQVSPEDHLVTETFARKVAVWEHKLILLVTAAKASTVIVYHYEDNRPADGEGSREVKSFSAEVNAVFSIPWGEPVDFFNPSQYHVLTSLQTRVPVESIPALSVCFKADSERDIREIDSGDIVLQSDLFQQLFGADLCLLGCPVIVAGTSSGRVYIMPSVPNVHYSEPVLLYDIQQPITAVCDLSITGGPFMAGINSTLRRDHRARNALVIVGVAGTVTVMYVKDNVLASEECHIDGPVYDCCTYGNILLHSNLTDTFVNEFFCSEDGKAEMKSELVGFHNTLRLRIRDSYAAVGSAQPSCLVDVLAFTTQGRLYSLQINRNSLQHPWEISNEGLKMKDMLTKISNVEKEMGRMQAIMQEQNRILQQLSLCCHLVTHHLQADDSVNNADSSPVCFRAKLESRDFGAEQQYLLIITLLSKSANAVIADWYATVHLESLGAENELDGSEKARNFTRSVALSNLSQGQSQDIAVQILPVELIHSLPLRVSATLSVHIPRINLSPENDKTHLGAVSPQLSALSKHTITIPVYNRVLDVTAMLRVVKNPKAVSDISIDCTQSSVAKAIRRVAEQRPSHRKHTAGRKCLDEEKMRLKEIITCSLLISSDAVKGFLGKAYKRAARKGNEKEIQSALLNALLSECPVQAALNQTDTFCKCLSPRNNQVLLSVKSRSRSEDDTGSDGDYLLNIQTYCPADLVDARRAFLTRIQEKSSPCEMSASIPQLRKYLRQVEEIRGEVEALQTQNAYMTPEEHRKQTLRLYSALRNILLKS